MRISSESVGMFKARGGPLSPLERMGRDVDLGRVSSLPPPGPVPNLQHVIAMIERIRQHIQQPPSPEVMSIPSTPSPPPTPPAPRVMGPAALFRRKRNVARRAMPTGEVAWDPAFFAPKACGTRALPVASQVDPGHSASGTCFQRK